MEKKKIALIAGGTVGGALLVIYTAFAVYYANRFQPNTTVDGLYVAGMTANDVTNALIDSAKNYTLTINGRGGTKDEIKGSDISLSANLTVAEVSDLQKRQLCIAWPISLFIKSDFTTTAGANFDKEALVEKVADLSVFDKANNIPPANATLVYENDAYVIVPETQGSEAEPVKTYEAVSRSIRSLTPTLDLEEADVYKKPTVFSDDEKLNADLPVLNKAYASFPAVIFGDIKELPDPEAFKGFVSIVNGEPSISRDTVDLYVESLAEKYDTIDKPRTFKDSGTGKEYEVPAGTYGWEMDQEATKEAVWSAMQETGDGERKEVTPTFTKEAAQFGEADYGDSYVAANLDDQHVYVVVDGEVVLDSDCVSGKAVVAHNTPDGVYYIFAMAKNVVLKGPGYESPVKNWMPFYHGVGFHDATWRSRFGGQIYIENGSHGCINLPLKFATELYDLVEVGTPVLVYGGMTQEDAKEAGYHTYTAVEKSDAATTTASATNTAATTTTVTAQDVANATAAAQAANAKAEAANQALANAQASGDAATIAQAQQAADAATAEAVSALAAANAAAEAAQAATPAQ